MTTIEAVKILAAIFPDRYVTGQVEAKRHVTDPPEKVTYSYGVYVERKKEFTEKGEEIPGWFYSDVSLEAAFFSAMKYFFGVKEGENKEE